MERYEHTQVLKWLGLELHSQSVQSQVVTDAVKVGWSMQGLGSTDPVLEKRHRSVVGSCVVKGGLFWQRFRRLSQQLFEERKFLLQLLGNEDERFVRVAGVQSGGVSGVLCRRPD